MPAEARTIQVGGGSRIALLALIPLHPDEIAVKVDRLHPLTDLPVPAEILNDETFSDHLEDLRRSRADLARIITAGILPNVFEGTRADLAKTRRAVSVSLAEAALTTELLQPLEDPFWRAEYAYPFPIAALARHYRIAASPAQRKEALPGLLSQRNASRHLTPLPRRPPAPHGPEVDC
ncbi:hypothetical protein ABZ744_27515 [Micromonospora chersina]|uniref:hypothetical protein n=1 Tax=Micromonospora chersina TaxID=47854 RepID=UPI0033E00612